MKHSEAQRLLVEYEEAALDADRQAEVGEHVDGCDECRAWSEAYRLISTTLAADASRHPSSEQLADYGVDPRRLHDRDTNAIVLHLAECDSCLQELESVSAAVHEARSPRVSGTKPGKRLLAWRLAAAAAIAAAIALVLFLGRDPGDFELEGARLGGTQVIEARGSLKATQVTVENGSDITLRAGRTVVLGDGFSVGSEANFKVELESSPDSAPQRRGTKG